MPRKAALGPVMVFLIIAASAAHANRQSPENKNKEQPAEQAPRMSGAYIYKWYCAACHGKSGKGDGPAASELKVPPPDLTTLAKRNKGKFPADYVSRVLTNGTKSAHGAPGMPVWGPLFSELNTKGRVNVQIKDVVQYLESMQGK
jgi:mono/diheme cytochrome c family protein